MIDIRTEDVISLADLAKRKGISYRTVHRWGSEGVVKNGHTVILETVELTSGKGTSWEAYLRFLEAIQVVQ